MNANPIPADDELLTRDQVCEKLKITKKVLWRLESAGSAPPRIRFGHQVRYPKSLFEAFLTDRVLS